MKWFKRLLFLLLGLIGLGLATVYAGSAVILNRGYEPVERNLLTSSRPDVISGGERLAKVYGCHEGCHGKDMQGQVFFEQPFLARVIAPNLTTAVERYSVTELEAIIRQGIKPDGKSVMGMPSASFSYLSDSDLSAIVSFIRSYPQSDHDAGESSFGPLARFGILTGEFQPAAAELREMVHKELEPGSGEYLAMNACSECHGMDLEGGFAPNLAIAKAYDLDAFTGLMREGKSVGGNELGLMAVVSRNRFAHFTETEIEALHAYLHSR